MSKYILQSYENTNGHTRPPWINMLESAAKVTWSEKGHPPDKLSSHVTAKPSTKRLRNSQEFRRKYTNPIGQCDARECEEVDRRHRRRDKSSLAGHRTNDG